jgi:hypothetical protein
MIGASGMGAHLRGVAVEDGLVHYPPVPSRFSGWQVMGRNLQ